MINFDSQTSDSQHAVMKYQLRLQFKTTFHKKIHVCIFWSYLNSFKIQLDIISVCAKKQLDPFRHTNSLLHTPIGGKVKTHNLNLRFGIH